MLDWTPGPRDQLAAAVGTPPRQHIFRAGPTEGALERTDASLRRLGWESSIAALAIGTKLKHEPLLRTLNSTVMRFLYSAAVP